MSTTVHDILASARAKTATVATSRNPAEFFLEHKTSQPFEKSPISKRDGFEVVARGQGLTSAFGVSGEKEGQFSMVVRLGHAPFGVDSDRENSVQKDIARLADIFEAYGSWPTGTHLVIFEKAETEKKNANWWLTEVFFKVVYTGAILT